LNDAQIIAKEFFDCRRNPLWLVILFFNQKNFEIIAIFTLALRDPTIRLSTAKVRISSAPKLTLDGGEINDSNVSRVSQS